MSQSGGKVPRDRKRRISDPAPYQKPPKGSGTMPTRHSPTRNPGGLGDASTADVLRELALLRKSIEGRFAESSSQVVNLKEELLSKMDANDQAISEVQLAITDVTISVDGNQRAIQEVRAEVERREVELPQKVKAIVQEALSKSGRHEPTLVGQRPRGLPRATPPIVDLETTENSIFSSSSTSRKKEEAYELARRSIRLWPVSREGDLRDRAVEYLVNELLMDQQQASDLDFVVKRVGGTRQPGSATVVKDEVLLTFASTRDRDEVRSYAKNLERRGRGVRLEVPDHLWPSFRVLQTIAFELKQKNGSLKRNILFDDAAMDLKLDVFLNEQWRTIHPAGARASLSKLGRTPTAGRSAIPSDELDTLLASSMDTSDA